MSEACGGSGTSQETIILRGKLTLKQQTNADRIRSMTDEELALFINSIVTYDYTAYRRIEGKMIEADTLDWLKQEVET